MTPDQRTTACTSAAELLRSSSTMNAPKLVAGFDGFVDRIIDVVGLRTSDTEYTRLSTIGSFAERVAAAAGRSANLELVAKRTALGGNGAILARAAGALGARTFFAGTIGADEIEPLFEPLNTNGNRAVTLGAPGKTEALEFDDGKLLLGEPSALTAVTWESILTGVGGVDALRQELNGAVLAMGNWTMTPAMTDIWHYLATEVLPQTRCRGVFIDLADPAKRSDNDLLEALDAMRAMNTHAPVTLGLNAAEAERLARLLGTDVRFVQETPASAELHSMAVSLHQSCGLAEIALHTRRAAAIADADGASAIDGPFTESPIATTGAGDHFNAGLCVAALLGAPREQRLAIGVACSGLFVRTSTSPTRKALADFLLSMPVPEPIA